MVQRRAESENSGHSGVLMSHGTRMGVSLGG